MYKIINLYGREYILYSSGKLFDIKNGVYRKPNIKRNYPVYALWDENKQKHIYKQAHRLVAEYFIPNPENKPCVDHIIPVSEGGTSDISNLRWVTPQENSRNEITYYKVNKAKEKAIIGMDENGNEICRFSSVSEAVKEGYSRHIACVANGKRKKSNKLYWKWL